MPTSVPDNVIKLAYIHRSADPAVTTKQETAAEILHTYAGGEASWAIFNIQAKDCPRCMNLVHQIMTADGSWSDG